MLQLPLLFAQEASELAGTVEYDKWADAFLGLDQEQRFILLLLTLLGFVAIMIVLPSVFATIYSGMHRRRAEMELKQDMLDRGMSAEEISEVIKAAPIEDAASRWVEGWRQRKKG